MRKRASKQAIKQASQAIVIERVTMTLACDHFRTQVSCSTNKGCKQRRLCKAIFGETKVCQSDMAVVVKETILGLQIPIQDLLRMKILEPKQYFTEIKHGVTFFKTPA